MESSYGEGREVVFGKYVEVDDESRLIAPRLPDYKHPEHKDAIANLWHNQIPSIRSSSAEAVQYLSSSLCPFDYS